MKNIITLEINRTSPSFVRSFIFWHCLVKKFLSSFRFPKEFTSVSQELHDSQQTSEEISLNFPPFVCYITYIFFLTASRWAESKKKKKFRQISAFPYTYTFGTINNFLDRSIVFVYFGLFWFNVQQIARGQCVAETPGCHPFLARHVKIRHKISKYTRVYNIKRT